MATDATGTPTSPDGLAKINPSVDAPSGVGQNSLADSIQTALTNNYARKPAGIVSGECMVWNGSGWDRSSVTKLGVGSLGSGTPAAGKYLDGAGTWTTLPPGAVVQLYDNIAGGSIASWDVSGISGSYSHLKLVLQARGDTAAAFTDVRIRFNNDSTGTYDHDILQSNGAASTLSGETFAATSGHGGFVAANTATANVAGQTMWEIANYASTTFQKNYSFHSAFKSGTAATNLDVYLGSGHWRSTAAINRITVFPGAGNFVVGSRLSIYGIL